MWGSLSGILITMGRGIVIFQLCFTGFFRCKLSFLSFFFFLLHDLKSEDSTDCNELPRFSNCLSHLGNTKEKTCTMLKKCLKGIVGACLLRLIDGRRWNYFSRLRLLHCHNLQRKSALLQKTIIHTNEASCKWDVSTSSRLLANPVAFR